MDDLLHPSLRSDPSTAPHGRSVPDGRSNPLRPLSAEEIRRAVAIVRADPDYGDGILFETIELMEPEKTALRAWPETALPRCARVNVFQADQSGLWRLVLDLDQDRVLSPRHVPAARPMIQLEQFLAIEGIVRADPEFVAACARRGITDVSKVCVDPWSAGNFGVPGEEGLHLAHTFCWLRLRENENFYAHPIEGLNAVVDIKKGKVLRVDDHGALPIPMAEFNYESQFRDRFRTPLKPLDVVQPEGPSFVLDGHSITWDQWSLVIGSCSRRSQA